MLYHFPPISRKPGFVVRPDSHSDEGLRRDGPPNRGTPTRTLSCMSFLSSASSQRPSAIGCARSDIFGALFIRGVQVWPTCCCLLQKRPSPAAGAGALNLDASPTARARPAVHKISRGCQDHVRPAAPFPGARVGALSPRSPKSAHGLGARALCANPSLHRKYARELSS